MDYNYFAAVTQPYQFSGYNTDNSFSLHQDHDSSNVSPVSEPLSISPYLPR